MDAAARAKLVADHLELARRAARTLHPRVREHVEFDELVAMGNAGLAEAADRYDPTLGASFATFAYYRVHGAMVDGLRRGSTLPRRTWAKLVALRASSEYLEHQAEREAGAVASGAPPSTTAETLAQVKQAISAIQTMYLTSLEGLRDEGRELPDRDTNSPLQQLADKRDGARVTRALAALPERERALLTKHYFEGKNLLEAGQDLGISKSWASRMHAQAIDRLREALAADDP